MQKGVYRIRIYASPRTRIDIRLIGVPFGTSIIFCEEMNKRRNHEDTRSFKRTEVCRFRDEPNKRLESEANYQHRT